MHNRGSGMRRVRNERGVIIIFSISVILLLTILGSAFLMRSVHEERVSELSTDWHRALSLAEASIDAAMMKQHIGDFTDLATATMAGGSYWAEVAPSAGPWQFLVNGHGLYESVQRSVEAVTQLTPTSVFQFALFGNQQVEVSGDVITDSYNSLLGPYDWATAGQNGDVGTNTTAVGGVTVDGSIIINGQMAVGPNVSNPDSVVTINGGAALITGSPSVVSQSVSLPMPAVTVPAWLTCTNLTVNGSDTIVLSSAVGAYCFDTLAVKGGGTLTADGPVKVYVTTFFHATGNTSIGVPSNPSYLTMLMTSTSLATIEGSFAGTTEFYGGLYAPNARIDISGDAEIFGSVIAQEVEVSGDAQVHYDESLGDLMDPIGLYRVQLISWREP